MKTTEHQVSWRNNQPTDDGTTWACGKAVRVQVNLFVEAMVCSPNPADAPAQLIDVILANAKVNR